MNGWHELAVRTRRSLLDVAVRPIRKRRERGLRDRLGRRMVGGTIVLAPENIAGEFAMPAACEPCFQIVESGAYSPLLMKIMEQQTGHAGETVIVGAGVGLLSIHLARLRQSPGTVFAFEADESAAGHLRDNIHRNGMQERVVMHRACVDARPGRIAFASARDCSESHIACGVSEGLHPEERIEEMTADTLDGILPNARVGLLVVDVVGAELRVLLGARNSLVGGGPTVIILSRPRRMARYGHHSWLIERYLQQLGYECRDGTDERLRLTHPFGGIIVARRASSTA